MTMWIALWMMLATLIAHGYAIVSVVEPWQNTTWYAAQAGKVQWTSGAEDATLACDVQLLNGDPTNANLVANLTNPLQPIPCSNNSFTMPILGAYPQGTCFVRVGQASTNTWSYSALFNFVSAGTVSPPTMTTPISNPPSYQSPPSATTV